MNIDFKLLCGKVDGFSLWYFMSRSDSGSVVFSLGNTSTWAWQNDEEIHTEDTDGWIILDAEIDVLSDTETEVSFLREAAFWEFIGFHTEGFFDDIDGLFTTNGNLCGDVLTTTDTKSTNCQTGFSILWLLLSKLVKNLRGFC